MNLRVEPLDRVLSLEVAAVVQETADAVSLIFRPTPGVRYRPGQFLTLRIPEPGGGSLARCYSLSSSPYADDLMQVTVKRTRGGYGSNWICDHVRPGDRVESLPPAGLFTPASLDDDLLLIAGGSGITPVISILRAALSEGTGPIVLVYANTDAASVIFGQALQALALAHPDRLTLISWLASERGLPTVEALQGLTAPYLGHDAFICGPGPLMAIATEALERNGAQPERIHVETFVSLSGDPFAPLGEVAAGPGDQVVRLQVDLYGQPHALEWPSGALMLDLMLSAGLDVPYSCREGSCGTCLCVLEQGAVRMVRSDILSDADRAAGYVLACQSLPDGADTKVVF